MEKSFCPAASASVHSGPLHSEATAPPAPAPTSPSTRRRHRAARCISSNISVQREVFWQPSRGQPIARWVGS